MTPGAKCWLVFWHIAVWAGVRAAGTAGDLGAKAIGRCAGSGWIGACRRAQGHRCRSSGLWRGGRLQDAGAPPTARTGLGTKRHAERGGIMRAVGCVMYEYRSGWSERRIRARAHRVGRVCRAADLTGVAWPVPVRPSPGGRCGAEVVDGAWVHGPQALQPFCGPRVVDDHTLCAECLPKPAGAAGVRAGKAGTRDE